MTDRVTPTDQERRAFGPLADDIAFLRRGCHLVVAPFKGAFRIEREVVEAAGLRARAKKERERRLQAAGDGIRTHGLPAQQVTRDRRGKPSASEPLNHSGTPSRGLHTTLPAATAAKAPPWGRIARASEPNAQPEEAKQAHQPAPPALGEPPRRNLNKAIIDHFRSLPAAAREERAAQLRAQMPASTDPDRLEREAAALEIDQGEVQPAQTPGFANGTLREEISQKANETGHRRHDPLAKEITPRAPDSPRAPLRSDQHATLIEAIEGLRADLRANTSALNRRNDDLGRRA